MKDILFQFPDLPDVFCVFQGIPESGHEGGKSWGSQAESVILKQKLLENYAALGLGEICACRQVHGVKISRKPAPLRDQSELEEADGMLADLPGLGLLIKTADCQPVLFAHASGKYIMAIHVGWRGNRANFPARAVGEFCVAYDLSPKDIFAVRGPSLCPQCSEFVNYSEEWGSAFDKWHNAAGKCVNLWEMTKDQLLAAGLSEANIFGIDFCTAENRDQFFSYRKNPACGRQASLVWMRKLHGEA